MDTLNNNPLQKIDIEKLIDINKPFKTEDGELINPIEYFENNTELIDPYVIIGPDGRKKVTNPSVMPYRAMTYILLEFDNYTASCSGTLVDNYKVLTNAHCLVDDETGKKPIESVILTQVKDNHYSQAYWGTKHITPSGYNGNTDLDYGVIILKNDGRPAPGIEQGKLPIKQVTNLSNNQSLKIYGYPADKTLDLWGMTGNLKSQTNTLAFYDIDTYEGQSGSGILNSSNEIVAIHAAGFKFENENLNGGPKMTKSVVNFIKNAK